MLGEEQQEEDKDGQEKFVEEENRYHHSVVCRFCFKTVDLTSLGKESITSHVSWSNSFSLYCPSCGKYCMYTYDEIKPLDTWPGERVKLEASIQTLNKENTQLKQEVKEFSEKLQSIQTARPQRRKKKSGGKGADKKQQRKKKIVRINQKKKL